MEISVSELKPNPYRKIEKYPIRKDKVDKLVASIGSTGFWDNILARKNGTGYQIAYGHHRLVAIKEAGLSEVDIPVKDLDDSTMIKIMASENMEDWETNTSVINETVLTVAEFLEQGPGTPFTRTGVIAPDTIQVFLGSGWDLETIKRALATLRDEKVDREAVEVFETPTHAQTLRREINKPLYDNVIPKEEQKEFAEEIKAELEEEGEVTSEGIQRKVFEKVSKKIPKRKQSVVSKTWNYKKCSSDWYKAARVVDGISILASDLTDDEASKVETFIKQIETKIQEWRNG